MQPTQSTGVHYPLPSLDMRPVKIMENRHPFYYLSIHGLDDPNCESLAILFDWERILLFEDGTSLIGNLRAAAISCPKDQRLFVVEDATENPATLSEIIEERKLTQVQRQFILAHPKSFNKSIRRLARKQRPRKKETK